TLMARTGKDTITEVSPAPDSAEKTAEKAETADKKVATAETGPDATDEKLALAGKLHTALSGLAGTNSPEGPHVEVTIAEGGVLVSVSDEFQFGMFDIGSAVPTRETVLAMAEIGKALANVD